MTDFDKKMLLGAVAALGVYLLYRKVANALPTSAEVVTAFNPTSDQNLAYKAASTVTEAVTGDPSFGGWIYDMTHDTSFITKTPEPVAAKSQCQQDIEAGNMWASYRSCPLNTFF